MLNTILKEAGLFRPNSARINFTIIYQSISKIQLFCKNTKQAFSDPCLQSFRYRLCRHGTRWP
ncbi:hypothetical protein EFO36_01260 [Lactococcus cremoris]|nr:hypothetical protein [Lactococcus cremoris]MCT4432300.1 hypothetical protein [Lactococcus cremoris]